MPARADLTASPGFLLPERRRADRRARPTPMLGWHALFGGRRCGGRRVGDTAGTFVDYHGARLFALVTGILVLNVLDAWFTLLFLSQGGQELNPFVQAILDRGVGAFLVFKTVGIGLCLAFLTLTKNFTSARLGMFAVFAGYLVLLGWHLYLLTCLLRSGF